MKRNKRFKCIFLITVDCLRADFVGSVGGGTNFTPNIDMLAKDSVVFTRAFANGPGTNQSFPAILTSTYFLMHGGMRLLPHYTTLAEVLNENSFKTVAFHSNPFLSKSLGWSRGFNEFFDFMDVIKSPSAFVTRQRDKGIGGKLARFASTVLRGDRSVRMQHILKKIYYKFSRLQIPYLEGRELNAHVYRWINKHVDEKFFLWMHYMDAHYPFIPAEPFLSGFSSREEAFEFNLSIGYEKVSKEELEVLRNLYIGEVRYVDACIGEFLQFLRDKALLEDSLILLMGDHGHAFMEHGRFGHAYDILYNEVLHVPLIIYGLGISKSLSILVQLLNVPATIIDIVNMKKPPSFMGDSLLPIIKREKKPKTPVFSESAKPDLVNLKYNVDEKAISCIVGSYKIIVNEMLNSVEMYDIDRDFEEKRNLIDSKKDVCLRLYTLIERHLKCIANRKKINSLRAKKGIGTN
jgi:arylsulfatase A-like enzyme